MQVELGAHPHILPARRRLWDRLLIIDNVRCCQRGDRRTILRIRGDRWADFLIRL